MERSAASCWCCVVQYYHLLLGNSVFSYCLPWHLHSCSPAAAPLVQFSCLVCSFSANTSVYILTINLCFCSQLVEPLLFRTHNVIASLFFSLLRQAVDIIAEDFELDSTKLTQFYTLWAQEEEDEEHFRQAGHNMEKITNVCG